MKRLLLLLALVSTQIIFAQAKKPTLMVVPSDAWCIENGYVMQFDDQGSLVTIPDYKRAFQENTELLLVVSKLNGLMAQRDFPLQNMESVIKSLNSTSAEDAMRTSKAGGEVAQSPIDELKEVAKADIIMQLTWTINRTGPKKSITFNLQGIDSYSNKQVATAVGTGAPSFSAEVPVLLEEAVIAHIDNFSNTLQDHFDDLFENGREVRIRVRKWDNWTNDLETEYNGEELGFLIEDWIAENTVEGRFSVTDATENMLVLDQVRIPLYFERNGRQRAMDTRTFANNLRKHLGNAPFNIEAKVTTRGLGEATIFLGSK